MDKLLVHLQARVPNSGMMRALPHLQSAHQQHQFLETLDWLLREQKIVAVIAGQVT